MRSCRNVNRSCLVVLAFCAPMFFLFSRCSGYLVIRKAGHYLFWTASDDGVLAQHAYHAKQR